MKAGAISGKPLSNIQLPNVSPSLKLRVHFAGATMQVLVEKSQSVTPEFYANVAPSTEIADVAVFLCSPASVGVNGQNIVVDRGSRETVVEMSGVFSLVPPIPI